MGISLNTHVFRISLIQNKPMLFSSSVVIHEMAVCHLPLTKGLWYVHTPLTEWDGRDFEKPSFYTSPCHQGALQYNYSGVGWYPSSF